MLELRGYEGLRRLIEDRARIVSVLEAVRAVGPAGITGGEIAAGLGVTLSVVARAAMWLLKYDYLTEFEQKDAT